MDMNPEQQVMGRRMKMLVPTNDALLKPKQCSLDKERWLMQNKRSTVAERHQDHILLRPFSVGEVVRMEPIDNKSGRGL
ncbi:hypothetical protein Hamer_G001415 [Homarus americanus]|uniref:Uncharacterized protein n=1 Tax=Homarus americanus TaxID=6706 RepID=A0A8J5TMQ6_HOMAM|nr:hypothetical protein Hamer_G001415 [Homarus americanus]